MTLPLFIYYVDTFSKPSRSKQARSAAIGILFLPPTLMPRIRMTQVLIVFILPYVLSVLLGGSAKQKFLNRPWQPKKKYLNGSKYFFFGGDERT
jgi:hypothetical protein